MYLPVQMRVASELVSVPRLIPTVSLCLSVHVYTAHVFIVTAFNLSVSLILFTHDSICAIARICHAQRRI